MILQSTYDYMGYSIYERHYRVPLSYDLTNFQILGILVQTTTPKGHFEITYLSFNGHVLKKFEIKPLIRITVLNSYCNHIASSI